MSKREKVFQLNLKVQKAIVEAYSLIREKIVGYHVKSAVILGFNTQDEKRVIARMVNNSWMPNF